MIPRGYILQPRSFDGSEASKMPPTTREVWFYILRNVNHKAGGSCKRGSGFFQLKEIQDALSWYVGYRKNTYSKPQLTKSIRRLREGNMVTTSKATRGIYITVLNYDIYQDPEKYEGNAEIPTKVSRRKRQGHTKNKNVKECKKQQGKETLAKEGKKTLYSKAFLSFWSEYPNKKAKASAYKAWSKINFSNGLLEKVMNGLIKAKNSSQWSKDNGIFIPHPGTWLNGERWEDEYDEYKKEIKIGGHTF